MQRPFRQIDVFTTVPYRGNPVAVVLDSQELDTDEMQRFAHWTNLSETTFVLPPNDPAADYRLRISAGGTPKRDDLIVQECNAGLIPIRPAADGLAFAAPPLVRSGPVEDELVREIASVLGIGTGEIVEAQWVDNGPGWVAVLLESADAVLALEPSFTELDIGVVGPHPDGSPEAFEVRGFFPKDGAIVEDPVTGSLNASLAEWLLRTGRASAPYVASQGTVLGRAGRVHVSQDDDGTIWVGGGTVTCVSGEVDL
jgi:PhzF family phenazine biosynthesis protein